MLNETFDTDLLEEEPVICCPVCWTPSDFCQGHGHDELNGIGDCEICGEALDHSRQGNGKEDEVLVVCMGHTQEEIDEYCKDLEEKRKCQHVA